MSSHAAITLLMMVVIIVLVFRGVSGAGTVFCVLPVVACLLMGYGPGEINGFIGDGLRTVSSTMFLMVMAVLYFGILHDAGVFKALIAVVVRCLGNSVLGSMWVAALVSFLTQLDGSGATTALCTIPTMRPVFEKQKIRMGALLLIESLASGILCLLPWAPGLCEAATYVGVDPYAVFRWVLPLMLFSMVLLLVLCVPLSLIERRRGAGISQEEFQALRGHLRQQLQFPMGKGVALFDGLLTLVLMGGLLSGHLRTNFAFGLCFGLLLVVNFPKLKDQKEYFKRQAPLALEMVYTMLGVGVLVGVNTGTGALGELAAWVIAVVPQGLLAYLPVLLCMVSMPLSITLGGTKNSVILPALIPMMIPFGYEPVQILGAVFATGIISANLSLFNATPYLALGLAGMEMRDHLRYSLLPVYGFSLTMLLFLCVSGRLI